MVVQQLLHQLLRLQPHLRDPLYRLLPHLLPLPLPLPLQQPYPHSILVNRRCGSDNRGMKYVNGWKLRCNAVEEGTPPVD